MKKVSLKNSKIQTIERDCHARISPVVDTEKASGLFGRVALREMNNQQLPEEAIAGSLGTCLVTGGCGFLGSFIVHQLVELVRSAMFLCCM